MKRETDPGRLLQELLDRHERRVERTRRITARPSLAFAGSSERDHLIAGLAAARDTGAVTLEWDRDAPHLIARVILVDADRLYRHLGRTPAVEQQDAAVRRLVACQPVTDVGCTLLTAICDAWADGRNYLGLAPAAVEEAIALVRAADAAFAPLETGPLPLRTRSARLLGDSKALERNLAKLLAYLRLSGRLDPALERDQALEELGLAKFPQPLLLAGPVAINGLSASGLAYLGLPPEAATDLALEGQVRSVLTIENLESFHRHVRECRGEGDLVVYCGGFPAQAVIRALRRLLDLADTRRLHHWGDIDAGGVRIGRFLEQSLPWPVVPHLMNEALAISHGQAVSPMKGLENIPGDSAFAGLARFLGSEGAHSLEQEMLDPRAPSTMMMT